jgi:hypothetical protein
MYSMHTGLRRRHRLAERAAILREMDMAIIREGGVSKLSQEELRLVITKQQYQISKRSSMVFTVLLPTEVVHGSDPAQISRGFQWFYSACWHLVS